MHAPPGSACLKARIFRGSGPGRAAWPGVCSGTSPEVAMAEVLYLIATVAFFALAVAYAKGCDKL